MRYINCCKSTRKNKKCTRKDGKHFSLQRRFTKKKCIKGPVKGFTMRASCAPYKFCKNKTRKKQRGGSEPEEKTQLPNLQESADILRSSLGIHRQGQNAMWENQVIRLALEGDERFTHLLGEEPLVAQKEQDPQDGGRVKRTKKRKTRKLLPKLRKISYKNKKHHYKLKDPFSKRKLAIHEGVNREAKKTGKTKKKAAIAKKGRFNILRIYRKNKKIKECNTITHDMRYMDRKYGLGKTKNICGQKGGTYNFPPDRPDSTFSNIDDLKFILSFYSPHNNNKIIIKSYTGDEDEHQLEPELASDTHILIVGAEHGIPFFLLQGAGFEIKPKGIDEYLTYVPPQQQGGRIPIKEKNFEEEEEEDPSTITIDEWEAQQQREEIEATERERNEATRQFLARQPPLNRPLIWVERGTEEHRRLIQEEREEEMRNEWVRRGLPLDEFTVNGLEEIWQHEDANPYEPYFFLGNEVLVENDEETGGIFDDDEATEFNIYDDETILDNIHYNPYSLWRVINIEFFEDDFPEYTLQSVDNNNLQIIRPQPMLEEYEEGRRGGRRKKKTRKKKKQFLYNPDDPSKSFDVYIDKNPKDTIPIKYTTVKDVKDTIKKLERLYKTKKYPHKRIWQVGMIMKVRLEAMLKHKTKKYPNAKKVKQRFNLANKYFKFLGKRTKKKDFKSRKAMTFKL